MKLLPFALTLLILSLLGTSFSYAKNNHLPICAYIASYAPDNPSQFKIYQALNQEIKNKCVLKTFYMHSKQKHDHHALKIIGKEAKNFIVYTQPDVLIFSDDHAVKYVLQPYFKNHSLPAVFVGVDKTGILYGLPYTNTTGMLERSGFPLLFKKLCDLKPGKNHIAYLTSFSTTEEKQIVAFHQAVTDLKITSSTFRTYTENDWQDRFLELNQDPSVDFIILGSIEALPEWNMAKNISFVKKHSTKILISLDDTLMPLSTLGKVKFPREQGIWAGKSVVAILEGILAKDIPIVANRNFGYWYNEKMMGRHPNLVISDIFRPFYETVDN